MSIAAQLETHLRRRVRAGLDQSRILLVQAIRDGISQAAQTAQGTTGEVSGQLKAGIICDSWSEQGDLYVSTVHSLAFYSRWLEEGTGVFGPSGGRIYPKRARALTFYWAKAGGVVSFRSVAGTHPFHFWSEPMPARFHDALEQGLSSVAAA